ncbi:MAG: alpha/beta hydrolase family protein [Actinomycetota bacterium]
MSRRARRARRRRWAWVGVGLALVGVVVAARALIGPAGSTGGDGRAVARTRPTTAGSAPSTAVTTVVTDGSPPTTAAPPGPPYAVEVARTTVVDPTRPTAARGPTPAASGRTLPVTVYVPRTPGPVPLVVFAHGYAIAAADYADLLRDLAAAGFVVAAPDFPLSSTVFPGPPTQADIDEQARDVAFLVAAFTDGTATGPWQGRIAAGEAGVVGHSDGANTVVRAASNSCCVTTRIGAAVALAGDEGATGGTWGVPGAPPMLFLQGTADTVNPWAFSQQLYDDAAAPKTLVAIAAGEHLRPFTTGPQRPAVVALVAAFLRGHLAADADALARAADLANRDDLQVRASS